MPIFDVDTYVAPLYRWQLCWYYPFVSGIYRRIDRKDMLVLAAIFHDIAKGRAVTIVNLASKMPSSFACHMV